MKEIEQREDKRSAPIPGQVDSEKDAWDECRYLSSTFRAQFARHLLREVSLDCSYRGPVNCVLYGAHFFLFPS